MLVAIALVTYNPADPPGGQVWPPAEQVHNGCGAAGAWVAHSLIEMLGLGAYYAAGTLGVVWQGIQPGGELEDVANRFSTAYGVGTGGAALIRPDGFIAWCQVSAAHSARALDDALERLGIRTAVGTGGDIR